MDTNINPTSRHQNAKIKEENAAKVAVSNVALPSKGGKTKVIWAALVILVIAAAVILPVVFFRNKTLAPQGQQAQSGQTQRQVIQLAIEASREIGTLLAQSPIAFAKIAVQTPVLPSTIPGGLNAFVLPYAVNTQAFTVTLASKQTGFRLVYDMPETVRAIHAQYVPKAGWSQLKSIYSNMAGMVILENKDFQVEATEIYVNPRLTRISILAVSK